MATQTIPKGWTITTLGEVTKITRGASPRPIHDFIAPTGIHWIKIADATASQDRFISRTKEFIKKEGVKSSVSVFPGDLIMSNSATPGIPKILHIEACIHDGWLLFRDIELEKYFLYYWLRDSLAGIVHSASGTVFNNLKTDIVKALEIILPPQFEQKAIAEVLSTLDDKIELLRKNNKTLENLAQTLFKRWFVEYEFPNEKGKPYKSCGGKMIDSDLGKIPAGWRVGKIGDVVDIRGGTTPSTANPEFWGGKIHWTSPKDLSNSKTLFLLDTENKITEAGLTQISSGLLPSGTLLLSSRAPIGYLAISNIEISINQGYIAFLPDQYFSNRLMYLWLKSNMRELINAANGSTFLEISKSSFRNIECVIPSMNIGVSFDEVVKPSFEKMLSNTLQIQTLSYLRDSLLPKLMKGELRVGNL
jgi:type I restriction enzyme S subunit